MGKIHIMIIAVQNGRAEKLSDQETKSTLARDVAPALAISIIAQYNLTLHTEKLLTSWGQLPKERVSSTVFETLSNWILRLGGAIRIVELLSADDKNPTQFSSQNKDQYLSEIAQAIVDGVGDGATGKTNIGLSSRVGFVGHKDLKVLLKMVKKGLKEKGVAARVVLPHKGSELNAAAIKYNNLTTKGYEFVLWPGGYLALTLASYDPDRDTLLDRGIPSSDPKAGMLPPKLARMMVNVALGQTSDKEVIVVDPFCGSGRVLLEALVLGYPVLGNDMERAQMASSKKNINWLETQKSLIEKMPDFDLLVGDARSFRGPRKPHVIVTEPWLGPPLREKPNPVEARRYADQVINIVRSAIKSWLINKPLSIVMALPRWKADNGQEVAVYSNIQEEFRKQGYHCIFIETVTREDAIVARDIVLAKPGEASGLL